MFVAIGLRGCGELGSKGPTDLFDIQRQALFVVNHLYDGDGVKDSWDVEQCSAMR